MENQYTNTLLPSASYRQKAPIKSLGLKRYIVSDEKDYVPMLYKLTIELSITPPINKENHEKLEPICKKLIATFDEIIQIYLHHNTLYLMIKGMAQTDRYLLRLGNMLGSQLQRHYKKFVDVSVVPCVQDTFTQAMAIEKVHAEMLYEEYVENLTCNPTADLFGQAAIVPFDKLPEFFRLGEVFKGKAYKLASHTQEEVLAEPEDDSIKKLLEQYMRKDTTNKKTIWEDSQDEFDEKFEKLWNSNGDKTVDVVSDKPKDNESPF